MRPAHCAQVNATERSGFHRAATTLAMAKYEQPLGSQLLSRGQSVLLVL